MRKVVSLLLIVCVFASLQFSSTAAEMHVIIEEDNYTVFENETILMIVTNEEDGTNLVAWLEKTDPATVYQWKGILGNPALSDHSISGPAVLTTEQMEDVEVFHINYVDKSGNAELQAITSGREDEVIEIMEGFYGSPDTWNHVYTSPDYSSPEVRIYEDDYVGAVELGLVELPAGIKDAATAISWFAKTGIPVPAALRIFQKVVKYYGYAQGLYEAVTLDCYRGSYMTERTGAVVSNSGSVTPVQNATMSRLRIITFLEETDDYLVDTVEILYAPSEYEYQFDTLAEDTYQLYVN